MVRIRLRRVGARHQPSYRIVAADKQSPRDGRFLEIIGHYNPRTEPAMIQIKEDRLFHWLQNGAQPSDSVMKLMRTSGAQERWERFKAGESLDKLLAEAEEASIAVDPRTRRDDLIASRESAPKPAGAETVAEPEAEPEAEAAVEAEAEAEPEVEAAVEAEAEAEPEAEAAVEAEAEAEPEAEAAVEADEAEEAQDASDKE